MASPWDNWSSGGVGGFAFPSGIDPSSWEAGIQSLANTVGGWFQGLAGGTVDTSGQAPAPGGAQPQSPGNQDLSSLLQMLGGASGGTASGGTAASNTYTTPDGVSITIGSAEDHYYQLVDAVWVKLFGSHADFAQARVFHDMGIQNTDQLNQVLVQMPSHIKQPDGTPINIGTYEDMLTTGNKLGQQYFGRPIPDSLITDWVAQGITEPAAIQNWFFNHPANDLPKDQYGAAWDAANQWTQQVWGNFKQ